MDAPKGKSENLIYPSMYKVFTMLSISYEGYISLHFIKLRNFFSMIRQFKIRQILNSNKISLQSINHLCLQAFASINTSGPKPLKFSWEESTTPITVDKDTEEWTYKQV